MILHEKNELHLKKQRRRMERFALEILSPLLYLQILILPLFALGLAERLAVPQGPITIRYSSAWMEGGGKIVRHYILEADTGRQFNVPLHIERNGLREDINNGQIKPGSELSVSWYPWILRDSIATLSSAERDYGNLSAYEAARDRNVRVTWTIAAIIFCLGLAVCGLVLAFKRKELVKTVGLIKKYKKARGNSHD